MDRTKEKKYRQLLINEKNSLLHELKHFSDDEFASVKDSTGELSSYDNHPADQGSNTYDREKDRGLRDNAQVLLNKVENALNRLEEGNYGLCEKCGQEIREERLETIPYATLCERCQAKEEGKDYNRDRPLEEENLTPPFGRGFYDETNYNAYDAEDTWQDVAQYGTSNTPQDVPEETSGTGAEAYIDSEETVGSVGFEDSIIDDEADNLEEASEKESTFTGEKGKDKK
ncbi:TraR/DksA C4-type zinc finger protein [Halothermothrix orenii]|uniref:Transcriptional regulator, TraR/DksA family n=1 Tax=Halothermothrix orenii (strain H 168 / OCM 544 / DSM 9562) TaxID=373903 RepID=B8CWL7_HALOH|nr:TraR/DksA C4-type zinc finger protein [Halothermothrix orenii]ACL69686.1 transcriptional regulator, TraR/DksA family [Halothermothrix orenii H 168]